MHLVKRNMLREHQKVRWVVEVYALDLEKMMVPAKKGVSSWLLRKDEVKRSMFLQLQWRRSPNLAPYPPDASTCSDAIKVEDGTPHVEPPICSWVIDGFLKWKDGNVHESVLLWIMLVMPTKTVKHGKEKEEEKYIGQTYIDLSKFTIGKNLNNIPMTSEKFDLTISIRTLSQSENPRLFRHMTRVPSEVPFHTISGVVQDEEPHDATPTVKRKWLLEQRQKLEGDLRRTMQELNRETDAALADNKRKQEQLVSLQREMEELEKRMRDKAPVERMRQEQEEKRNLIAQLEKEEEELQTMLDELRHREENGRTCDCLVM
eukprot:GGOE01061624.1.p1 GENE.GGOE01061624.1~~GGOE01061624.1.p1  ORF type:complete len:318 (+),score=149.69 GGOE01061624.1:93-1046(+)